MNIIIKKKSLIIYLYYVQLEGEFLTFQRSQPLFTECGCTPRRPGA